MNPTQNDPILPVYRQAIYNPGRLTDAEIKASFIVRQALLEALLEDIDSTRPGGIPQHHFIAGQRGMGKTTLLCRLAAALRETGRRPRFVPLRFPEEPWTLDRLSKLWLNCLDSLADALEREGGDSSAIREIDATVESLRQEHDPEELLAEAAEKAFLKITAGLGRRPVLLVDNLDWVFERLNQHEMHCLRASLMKAGAPVLIGAAISPPQATVLYEAPFYDHFKTHFLERLNIDEVRQVLLLLARRAGNGELARRIDAERPRLETLHALTGGNPRTTVILYQIFAKGFSQEAYQDLEALLDWMTPLYKARFEELPVQAQIIVGALAIHWEPATAGKLGSLVQLENSQVSPQLDRLTKAGFVEAVLVDPEDREGTLPEGRSPQSRTGYQLADRFFNIWFLMRQATRRDRRNLTFLTRFIECVHAPAERSAMARDLLGHHSLSRGSQAYGLEATSGQESQRDELHDRVQEEVVAAETVYRTAIERDVKNALIWNQLGLLLSDSLGRETEAVDAFKKAIEFDPPSSFVPAANLVGVLRDQLGRTGEAQQVFQNLAQPTELGLRSVIPLQAALFAAHAENWGIAAENLGKALDLLDDKCLFPERTLTDWMGASAVLLHLGYGAKLLEYLRGRGEDQRLRPWYEAIRAHLRGDRRYLRNTPVEVRPPAEMLYDQIALRLRYLPAASRRWSPPAGKKAAGRPSKR